MVTVIIQAKVKLEKIDEFLELASNMTQMARSSGDCITYAFNQRVDDPQAFILYEQWNTQEAIEQHIKRLVKWLGSPKPGGMLPEKLIDMYEEVVPHYYTSVE